MNRKQSSILNMDCMKEKLADLASKIARYKKRLVVILILCIIAFPFCADQLYGRGYLNWYTNYFSADTWFSFVASYFSATIMGGLTIYQAYLIDKKDRQLQQVLNRNRFSAGTAFLYKYDAKTKKIGNYTADIIRRELVLTGRQLSEHWKNGHILSLQLKNLSYIDLNKICCKSIELKGTDISISIGEKELATTYTLCNDIYTIWIFWILNYPEQLENIDAYFCNYHRKDDLHELLDLCLAVQITDNEEEISNFNVNLIMQNQEDECRMQSRKSSITNL